MALPLLGLAFGAGARFLPMLVARTALGGAGKVLAKEAAKETVEQTAKAAAKQTVRQAAKEAGKEGAEKVSVIAGAEAMAAALGAESAKSSLLGTVFRKGLGFMGWSLAHPFKSAAASAAVVGTAHTLTDGLSTEYVAKPAVGLASAVGGAVVGGTVEAGKAIIFDAPAPQAETSRDGQAKSGPMVSDVSSGPEIGSQALSGMVATYSGLMKQNGLYALPLLFGGLSAVSGHGNMAQSAMRGIILATTLAFGVRLLENMGIKAGGISSLFNVAGSMVNGADNFIQPLAALNPPAPEKAALTLEKGLQIGM